MFPNSLGMAALCLGALVEEAAGLDGWFLALLTPSWARPGRTHAHTLPKKANRLFLTAPVQEAMSARL